MTHIIRLDESPQSPPFSGAENHLLFLLPALAARGIDVELVIIFRSEGPLMQDVFRKLTSSRVRVTLLPLAVKANWYLFGSIAIQRTLELVKLLRTRRDRIIHLHLDYFGAPVAAWLAACPKVVMSIHNDEQWFGSYLARLWLHLLNLIIKHYIAISDRVRDYYISIAGVRPSKIKRIYYGVDYSAGLSRMEVREKYNFPSDRFIFGFVGRLVYQKNVALLIEAARRLPETHCVIVGEGELREALEKQAGNLANVQFLGYQPHGYKLMTGFDLFCLPSRFEGLGLVLVEAMLQNVPIVASRAGAIAEILGEGDYGLLFDEGDLDGLVTCIRYAMKNAMATDEIAQRAQEYAQGAFTIEKMTSLTHEFYDLVDRQATSNVWNRS